MHHLTTLLLLATAALALPAPDCDDSDPTTTTISTSSILTYGPSTTTATTAPAAITSTTPTDIPLPADVPASTNNNNNKSPHHGNLALPLTAEMLLRIAPSSASCKGATYPSECRTASQAVGPIAHSFTKYNITHGSVQAALISLMAYETGDFKYGVNHFPAPGTPGQGTRNMQSPEFNRKYAKSLGVESGTLPAMMEGLTQDKYSWGSAAWFVSSQCEYKVRKGMWDNSEEGWGIYLKDCVGTTADSERKAYWTRAMKELVPKF